MHPGVLRNIASFIEIKTPVPPTTRQVFVVLTLIRGRLSLIGLRWIENDLYFAGLTRRSGQILKSDGMANAGGMNEHRRY